MKKLLMLLLVPIASSASAQTIQAPASALIDAPLHVRVTAAQPGQIVILRAVLKDAQGNNWESYASFKADARGHIDPAVTAPLFGSYAGADAGGLITSMQIPGDKYGRARFATADTLPLTIYSEVNGKWTDSAKVQLVDVADGVSARTIRDHGLVGTLYSPSGNGRHPAILVLGGSEGGGGPTQEAALLASHGYVAFALGYFGADGLPPQLDEIPLEYFGSALDFLRAQNNVNADAIGLLGTSKGAEAGLLIATHFAAIHAAALYAPSSVVWSCICGTAGHSSWSLKDMPVPSVPAALNPAYRPPAGFPIEPVYNYRYRMQQHPNADARIPAASYKHALLLIAGDADHMWPSAQMAREIMSLRKQIAGDQLLVYPGAGHLIGKAYLPAGSTVVGAGPVRLQTGGTASANARAQADAWPRVLAFFHARLF